MAVSPIGPFVLPATLSVPRAEAAGQATGFGDAVAKGLESLQEVQANADTLAQQAATGDLTDVHDYMIASTKASVATELTVAVRNRAVEAFNEIMRMQI